VLEEASAGGSVLVLAGLSWRILASVGGLIAFSLPLAWALLHDYQRNRILTFLDPERDPLGAGYHTIQAKIAIGSGGIFGKGWLNGSQAHLNYLPEHATDFIFAVVGEELGLLGCFVLLCIYAFIIFRAWQISIQAKDTFSRLVAGSITITFFLSVFINAGMVVGILPVVGLPLPLVSYGGTAMVINMMNFGILMSIHAHRRLLGD
jgi:rod shape determining protein RodA